MIIDINSTNYDQYMTNSENFVILGFSSKNCGPCKILDGILEEIEQDNKQIVIGKIDIEENPDLAIKFGVMSIPTMVIFREGKVLQKISGLKDKEFIEKLLK